MKIFGVYTTNDWQEKTSIEYKGWFSTIEKARKIVEQLILENFKKVIIEETVIDEFDSCITLEVYDLESGLEYKSDLSDGTIGMLSKNSILVEKLNNQFIEERIEFFGNDEYEAFEGLIDSFNLDTDGSIYVTLIDQDDCYFDVSLNETNVNLSDLN